MTFWTINADQAKTTSLSGRMEEVIAGLQENNVTIAPADEDEKYSYNYPLTIPPEHNPFQLWDGDVVDHIVSKLNFNNIHASFQTSHDGLEWIYFNPV
jgi:hypothetical protein